MPLPQPNLDTRSFDDLVVEMRSLIPQYAPEWTNHNPSDPGMTLVELLAWITEAILYRINRIPEKTYVNFFSLLLGEPLDRSESLESAERRALEFFHEPYRAVTAGDFEREAKRASGEVSRVRILPNPVEGKVVVVIVPESAGRPSRALLEQVNEHLDERRLVGTRLLVRGPIYTGLTLDMELTLRPNTVAANVKQEVENDVRRYLHPLTGGPDERGWPFGRPVSIFELYHRVEKIAGVDHVEGIVLNGDPTTKESAVQDLPDLQSLTVNQVSP